MKVIKSILLAITFMTMPVYAIYAPVKAEIAHRTCEIGLHECILHYAYKYGVDENLLTYIIEHESTNYQYSVGDMNLICKKTGKPIRARGILQITECYHPEITDECAFNIECSLDKMILQIKDKDICISQWTTCRQFYSK